MRVHLLSELTVGGIELGTAAVAEKNSLTGTGWEIDSEEHLLRICKLLEKRWFFLRDVIRLV